MFTILVIIHVVICVLLVCTVLLQQGKGAEVGAVFGSSEAVFGSAGPTTFLSKMTSALAILFMLTSLTLTYLASNRGAESVMQDVSTVAPKRTVSAEAPEQAPAAKVPAPAALPAHTNDGQGGAPEGGNAPQ